MFVPSRPLISVVVASYNYEEYIGVTLSSILNQTEARFEIIVVDDASTDRSRDVVKSFSDRRISLLVNDHNLGPSRTYNRGAVAATGTYITYLDADDWIEPQKFELQVGRFNQSPHVDILGTYADFRSADGSRHPNADVFERRLNRSRDLNDIDAWAAGNLLPGSSVMLRRTVHEEIGFRDPAMTTADFELWTRAMAQGLRFDMVKLPLLFYRRHDRSANYLRRQTDALFELTYAVRQNLIPRIGSPAAFRAAMKLIMKRMQKCAMSEDDQCRHLALMLGAPRVSDFAGFKASLDAHPSSPIMIAFGKEWYQGLHARGAAKHRDFDIHIERYLSARPFEHAPPLQGNFD